MQKYEGMVANSRNAPLAQLVEHLPLNPGLEKQKRLVGQAVKTPASHAGNMGSIPIRVTKKKKVKKR